MNKGTLLAGVENRALPALLAELRVLDARLEQEIARLRREQAGLEDDRFRGLVIGEQDVDSWLGALVAAETQALPPAPAVELPPTNGHAAPASLLSSPMQQLGAAFKLTPFDLRVLLTCLAPELHVAYGGLYAYIQDDVTRKYASVDLALTLWCDSLEARLAARARFHPTAPLRRHRLIQVADEGGAAPLLTRAVTLDPRIIAFLLGHQEIDPLLAPVARLIPTAAPDSIRPITPPRQPATNGTPPPPLSDVERLARLATPLAALDHAAPGLADAAAQTTALLVPLIGPDRGAKEALAAELAATLGRPLLRVETAQLLATDAAPGPAARLDAAFREALLQPAVLFWEQADALLAADPGLARVQAALRRNLSTWPGVCLLDLTQDHPDAWPHSGPLILRLDFPTPSTAERRALWAAALPGGAALSADVDLDLLAGSFRLNRLEIATAAASAAHAAVWRGPGAGVITMRDLLAACRTHSNQQLGLLARKIVPHYTWRDLVLPPDRLAQLREVCSNVRFGPQVYEQWGFDRKLSYGKGLNVLFSGPPGTGKTMAAEVLATDLGLDLYKIDLSTVVSKYIGETEKNLERIFREGRTSNAILFFDEADALFGKRSEVKDSHDRYANIEIGYLLQKMEEYDGIVILATNLRKNLDEAFVRRLHGAIDFPMPDEADRLRIWQTTVPPEAPLDPTADLPFLAARFKMSGGNIKNIVLAAAFLAAEEGTIITTAHLVRATRRELQKIGKLALEADFGPYYALVRVGS